MTIIRPSLNLVARAYEGTPNGVPAAAAFTRAGGAWRTNARGVLEYVGANIARHDYDGASGEYRGWLLEGASTNLMLYGSTLATGWGAVQAVVSTSGVTDPTGAAAAPILREDASNGYHYVAQSVGKAASAVTYAASFHVHASSSRSLYFGLDDGTGYGVYAVFNPAAGVFSSPPGLVGGNGWSGPTGGVAPCGNGWYRVWIGATSNAATTVRFIAFLHNGSGVSYVGGGSAGACLWGVQVEAQAVPTSYIQTAGAAATRAADVMSIPLAGALAAPSEGTLYVDALLTQNANYPQFAQITDGTGVNAVTMFADSAAGTVNGWVNASGALRHNRGVATAIGTRLRGAVAWAATGFRTAVNGAQAAADSGGPVPSGLTRLHVGAGPAGGGPPQATVQHVAVFARAFAFADLQTITT